MTKLGVSWAEFEIDLCMANGSEWLAHGWAMACPTFGWSCSKFTISVRVSQNLKKIMNVSVVRSWIKAGVFVIALYMSWHLNSNFYSAKIHQGIWAEWICVNKVKNQGFTKNCHTMSHVLMPWIHTKCRLLLSCFVTSRPSGASEWTQNTRTAIR